MIIHILISTTRGSSQWSSQAIARSGSGLGGQFVFAVNSIGITKIWFQWYTAPTISEYAVVLRCWCYTACWMTAWCHGPGIISLPVGMLRWSLSPLVPVQLEMKHQKGISSSSYIHEELKEKQTPEKGKLDEQSLILSLTRNFIEAQFSRFSIYIAAWSLWCIYCI